MSGLPRPWRRKPRLLGVDTSADLVKRRFTADGPNELWFTNIERHEALLIREQLGHPHVSLGEHGQARAAWREALKMYQNQARRQDAARVWRELDDLTDDRLPHDSTTTT